MAGFSTAFPNSCKQELAQGIHVFAGTVTATGTTTNTSNHVTALGTNLSALNVVAGMGVSGTGIPAGSLMGFADTSTSFYLSTNTGAVSNATASGSPTITFTGDDCRVALGIASPAGTYGAATTNWGSSTGTPSNANMGTDELAGGSGYTQGGYDLTVSGWNTPTLGGGSVAYWTPNVNPSWTSASFSTSGCLIYNNSKQTRAVYVGSFGGTQTVTSGTFTILMPTNNNSTALLRLA